MEENKDVWTLLGQGQLSRQFMWGSKVRTDVYICCTEGVGLKIRGGQELLEIKVRGERHPCGAEHWNKVCS